MKNLNRKTVKAFALAFWIAAFVFLSGSLAHLTATLFMLGWNLTKPK